MQFSGFQPFQKSNINYGVFEIVVWTDTFFNKLADSFDRLGVFVHSGLFAKRIEYVFDNQRWTCLNSVLPRGVGYKVIVNLREFFEELSVEQFIFHCLVLSMRQANRLANQSRRLKASVVPPSPIIAPGRYNSFTRFFPLGVFIFLSISSPFGLIFLSVLSLLEFRCEERYLFSKLYFETPLP